MENSIMKPRILPALSVTLVACGCMHGGARVADVASLVQRTAEANKALVRGDVDDYIARTDHAADYTLMAPFGGTPVRGFDTSPEHRTSIARFFTPGGTLDQEVVAIYDSRDLVVLVTIEHVHGAFGGLPAQDWSLRVTQAFRRHGDRWQLVHRHADPLGNRIELQQAAALARANQQDVARRR